MEKSSFLRGWVLIVEGSVFIETDQRISFRESCNYEKTCFQGSDIFHFIRRTGATLIRRRLFNNDRQFDYKSGHNSASSYNFLMKISGFLNGGQKMVPVKF